jgi:ketosteroid isomerase-like protein
MSQENVEVVRRMFEAYEKRDMPAVLAGVHPEVEVHPGLVGVLEGTVYRGRDGFKQFLEEVDVAWVEYRIEPEEFRDLADTVLVLGRARGRGRDGIVVDAHAGWVAVMREGKVRRWQSFANRHDALEAVGLSE